jgi:hypothetical protein
VSYGAIDSHPHTVSIYIPLDSSLSGTLVLGSVASKNDRILQELEWIETRTPGEYMPITHVGIRKGGMVTMDAYATRLTLETPYISLPSEIYDILIQATNPEPFQNDAGYDDVVHCGSMERFPDLVLGLEPGNDGDEEDEDTKEREIVITPNQYVLELEDGKCILLAKRAHHKDREEVMLGWAAVRGRDLVLDWINERTGFGR